MKNIISILTIRFTEYFSNDWIETDELKIIFDSRHPHWKLHRAW